jgi:hypothetical protein
MITLLIIALASYTSIGMAVVVWTNLNEMRRHALARGSASRR